jgi:cytochrome c oxidase subunit 4
MATESTHLPVPPTGSADHSAATHDEHETHVSHDGVYRLVYAILVVLTGLELLATYSGVLKIPILIALSATKAILVAAFYMHLKYEKPFLPLVFAGPIVIAVLALLAIQQLVLR